MNALASGPRAKSIRLVNVRAARVAERAGLRRDGKCGQFTAKPVHGRASFSITPGHIADARVGPAFVKVGTCLPYPVRVCLNGNEWAKQQLRRTGVAVEALDNGFRWCGRMPVDRPSMRPPVLMASKTRRP
jgi:hypothetical protein